MTIWKPADLSDGIASGGGASTQSYGVYWPAAIPSDLVWQEVVVNGDNHHIAKTGLIGQINVKNQFDIVWKSDGPIEPDPFLKGYSWWDPNAG